jgi:hypothetical protein
MEMEHTMPRLLAEIRTNPEEMSGDHEDMVAEMKA